MYIVQDYVTGYVTDVIKAWAVVRIESRVLMLHAPNSSEDGYALMNSA